LGELVDNRPNTDEEMACGSPGESALSHPLKQLMFGDALLVRLALLHDPLDPLRVTPHIHEFTGPAEFVAHPNDPPLYG
jgi:hypothetical protein